MHDPHQAILADLDLSLAQLSDRKIVAIAGLLDQGGIDPKALKGRAILRDRLRVLRPPRLITPCRLFCVPFEMLLSDEQAPQDPLRQISRAAIMPAWQQIERRLPPDVVADAAQAGAEASSPLDEGLRPAALALWRESSRVIDGEFEAIASRVGERGWMRQIGGAMHAHAPIVALRELLGHGGRPEPEEALRREITGLVHNALKLGEDAAYAAALTAGLHFASPGALIAGLLNSRVTAGSKAGGAMLRRLSGTIMRDIAWHSVTIARHARELAPHDLVAGFEELADTVLAMRCAVRRNRHPELRRRAEQAVREARGIALDTVLPRMRETIDRSLDAALAGSRAGGAAHLLEDALSGLCRSRRTAAALDTVRETEGLLAAVAAGLRSRADEAEEGELPGDRRKRLFLLARYIELIEGSPAAQACLADWLR